MPFDIDIDTEIEAWRKFGDAFRQENRELFERMMLEIREYGPAFDAASSKDSAEALLMALIFHQQKMITELIRRMEKSNPSKVV
jgi:hypothetical protein